MTDTSSTQQDAARWSWPFSALTAWPQWPSLAPKSNYQDINPGWSFGNVITVNSVNSTAPDVERAVVSQHSYGRQIGRLMDAVAALIDVSHVKADDTRITQFQELKAKIDAIKKEMPPERIARLRREIQELHDSDKDDERAAFKELQALFGRK
jgi:hypothetical protein